VTATRKEVPACVALRERRLALGIDLQTLAYETKIDVDVLRKVESGRCRAAHRISRVSATLEDLEKMAAAEKAAQEAWSLPGCESLAPKRHAMLRAAQELRAQSEWLLGHWLLACRPSLAAMRSVSSGVAVHALRRSVPSGWDLLMEAELVEQWAIDAWDVTGVFDWGPEPGDIFE
jgi:hypothetical protein